MTAVELERIARSIIPPVGATMAIARVDDQLKHRAAFLIDGRIHGDPVGPAFDRPRDAIRLVDLLNGEAPRPGQSDLAGPGGPTSRDAAGQPEAPGSQLAASLSCSAACRERARYRRAHGLTGADNVAVPADLTPSRPSQDELGR